MTATECVKPDYVILVDEQNREIGLAEKLAAHRENLLHRAFSIFIYRLAPQIEILLQQRAAHKYHSPLLWTNTCCSHPRSGESIIAAGSRRLQEELGISTPLTDLGWFQYNACFDNGLSEHEIDHVLIGKAAEDLVVKPNPEEVHAYRWISIDALQKEYAAHREQFTPWMMQALEIARKGF